MGFLFYSHWASVISQTFLDYDASRIGREVIGNRIFKLKFFHCRITSITHRRSNVLHKTFLRPFFGYKILIVLLVGSLIMSLVDLAWVKLDCPSNVETTNGQPAADSHLGFSYSCVYRSRIPSSINRLSCCLFNGAHVGCNCLRSPGNQTLCCKTFNAFFTGGHRSSGGKRLGP